MDGVSAEFSLFKQSEERLIRFYVQLVGQAAEKLQPSSRHKLDEKINATPSIKMNIQLLQEAQLLMEDERENLLEFFTRIKASGDHGLLIEYIDGVVPYLGYRGDWKILGDWLEQGRESAELCQDSESLVIYLLDIGWLANEKGESKEGLRYYAQVLKIIEENPLPFVEALTYLRLGWLHSARGERNKAQEHFEKSQALYRGLDDQMGIANTTLGLGALFSNTHEWEAADRELRIALKLYDQIGDATGVAAAYNNLAWLALSQNDLQTAREYYLRDHEILNGVQEKQSLAKSELALGILELRFENYEIGMKYLWNAQAAFFDLGSYPELAEVYRNLAYGHMKQGDFNLAIEQYQLSLDIYERLEATRQIAETNRQLGFALVTKGDEEHAEEHFRIAHEKFSQLNDPRGLQDEIIRNASKIFEDDREFQPLLDFYQELRNKFKKLGSKRGLAQVDIALGDTFSKKTEYLDQAIASYEQALSIFESLHESAGLAQSREKLGWIYRKLGRLDDAIVHYNGAASLYETLGDSLDLAWTYSWLGKCHVDKQQWSQALELFNKGLDVRSRLRDESGLAWSHMDIGNLYQEQNMWEESILQFQDALLWGRKINNVSLCGWACQHLGDIFLEKEDIENTFHCYFEAKSFWNQTSEQNRNGMILTRIGRAYQHFGQFEKALEMFIEAMQIAEDTQDIREMASKHIDLAETYAALNRDEEALNLYQAAVEILRDNNDSAGLIVWIYKIAQIYETRNEWSQAIRCYEELIEISKSTLYMNQSIASFYGHLGEAYFNNGDPNRAIECYQACLPILEDLDDSAVAAGIHLGLAIIYEKLGWAEDELRAHEDALKFIEKAPSSDSLGFYQRWVADSYVKVDQYNTALNYYILSLSTFAQQNNFEEMISAHGKIALTYSRLAVPEKVKEHIEIAVSLLDEIKDLQRREEATAYIHWLLSSNTPL